MTTVRTRTSTLTALLTAALSTTAQAAVQDPAVADPAAADAAAPPPAEPSPAATDAAADPEQTRQTPWIKRHRPVRNSWELGIYGGVFLPSADHEFYAPNTAVAGFGHQPLARAGADIGLRIGYYPLSFLGLEFEGGLMPMKAADGSKATLYTLRPVALFQLPYRIAPFVRAGFGGIGISAAALGKDLDPTFNIGGGVKFYLTQRALLRLDIVDNVATAVGVGNDRSNNLEVLLGLSLRLGKQPKEAPKDQPLIDSDGDGLYDPGQRGVPPADVDACPQQPGPRETQGCPLVDSDGDGLYDPGQPVPPTEIDDCPQEPGPRELKGCPDRDGDKIVDKLDKCPDEPETVNQIDDLDGCPDKVPDAVKKITGVLQGIYFDVDKDTIKPRSKAVLDRAVAVLQEHPTTRWNIQGHTDSDGGRDHNIDLSQRRAEAVRKYLVDRGVDTSRLVPQGFGPDEPIDSNATSAGKARNRRIEFRLID